METGFRLMFPSAACAMMETGVFLLPLAAPGAAMETGSFCDLFCSILCLEEVSSSCATWLLPDSCHGLSRDGNRRLSDVTPCSLRGLSCGGDRLLSDDSCLRLLLPSAIGVSIIIYEILE